MAFSAAGNSSRRGPLCVPLGRRFQEALRTTRILAPKTPASCGLRHSVCYYLPRFPKTVKDKVGFTPDVSVINTGNDRPNINYAARHLETGNRYHNLDFLFKDPKKTVVYFNTLMEAKEAYDHLLSKSTNNGATLELTGYYSVLSKEYKMDDMKRFRRGQVTILLATEAAGMGCDVNDIIRVVQFGAHPCILTIFQRLGRAACNPLIQGDGILLYSAHQALGNVADQRALDFISTKGCRREVFNGIFANRPPPHARCCDYCHRSPDQAEYMPLKPHHVTYVIRSPCRTQEEKAHLWTKLLEWRSKTFKDDYFPLCPFLPNSV